MPFFHFSCSLLEKIALLLVEVKLINSIMKDYGKYSDAELLTLIKESGESADNAFHVLYSRYSERTYGYCIFRSDSCEDAQELMQETWIRFYKSVSGGKTPANVLPYLFTIARNLNIDRYRDNAKKKNPDLKYIDEETLEKIADPFDFQKEMEKEELAKLVKIAVSNLDDIYKDTFTLYWFGDLNYKEIASIVEETEACVRTRIKRAFEMVAKIIKPYLTNIYK